MLNHSPQRAQRVKVGHGLPAGMQTASTTRSMKKALRRTLQIFCLFFTAVGAIATVVAVCFTAVMLIASIQEGRLQFEDKRMLIKATAWVLGSLIFVAASW